jgi:isopenicillin-N N-acyltransferase like protein
MADRSKTKKRRWIAIVLAFIALCTLFVLWFNIYTTISPPNPTDTTVVGEKVQEQADGFRYMGKNWMQRGSSGLWEMYLEGAPFERGVVNGKLSVNLIEHQEQAFTDQIRAMIPSPFYLHFLKYFIYWFNRNLDEYIPEEYKLEIYGISLSASEKFSYIGSNYQRMLNYHSAHDIGHALKDLALVGCTSFAGWGSDARDGTLIIGRNFDFYMGDAFAENKMVCFEKPDSGYPFMMVTWGGMIGTVSGMNLQGLTVTINAAKSDIPWSARTPISILAREILQYATNIEEAYQIAQKRETFVSESILIGSAKDNMAAIIEKSPFKIALVKPSQNTITCVNHFQSTQYTSDPLNISNMKESASVYRQKRLFQEISAHTPLDVNAFAAILRDQKGLNNINIGMGNEKAINQLIAHHSVIFQPAQGLVWVSSNPWQIGDYVCYDLNKIFNTFAALKETTDITDRERTIPPDQFLNSPEYDDFQKFRNFRKRLMLVLKEQKTGTIPDGLLDEFKASNPGYFEVYALSGDYYLLSGNHSKAAANYRLALGKEIPGWSEKQAIIRKLAECNVVLQTKKR